MWRSIARALQATLAPAVSERIERVPTASLEAYDLYARGRYLWAKGTREGVEESIDLFQRVLALDSTYALAHAGLADSYSVMAALAFMPESEALSKAKAAAETAVRLDPQVAAAHTALGTLLQTEMRWEEARAEFERALELDPGSSWSHQAYGWLLLTMGRTEEALAQVRHAVVLDPLSFQSRMAYATVLFFAREYDGAIEEAAKVIELEPERHYVYYIRGFAHAMKGEVEEAVAAVSHANEINGGEAYTRVGLAYLYAMSGHREKALEILRELEGSLAPLREIAYVYGVLGELDRAFEYLDRAFVEEPASLSYMMTDPTSDPLREDPRYGALLRRLGVM